MSEPPQPQKSSSKNIQHRKDQQMRKKKQEQRGNRQEGKICWEYANYTNTSNNNGKEYLNSQCQVSIQDGRKDNSMWVKVKTMNGNLYDLQVYPSSKIGDLQALIQQKTGVPTYAQRLLYKALMLSPDKKLQDYGIVSPQKQGNQYNKPIVIKLVANRIPSERSSPSSIRQSQMARTNALTQQNLLYKKHRYAQQRINGFNIIDDSERINDVVESLRQNVGTLNQLVNCVNQSDHPKKNRSRGKQDDIGGALSIREASDESEEEDKSQVPFLLENRQLQVGDWVDVRENQGTWVEGQIIRKYSNFVQVHYNGLPEHWNQWIAQSSQRIMPFKSQTVISEKCPILSPTPMNKPFISNLKGTSKSSVHKVLNDVMASLPNILSKMHKLFKQSNGKNLDPSPLPTDQTLGTCCCGIPNCKKRAQTFYKYLSNKTQPNQSQQPTPRNQQSHQQQTTQKYRQQQPQQQQYQQQQQNISFKNNRSQHSPPQSIQQQQYQYDIDLLEQGQDNVVMLDSHHANNYYNSYRYGYGYKSKITGNSNVDIDKNSKYGGYYYQNENRELGNLNNFNTTSSNYNYQVNYDDNEGQDNDGYGQQEYQNGNNNMIYTNTHMMMNNGNKIDLIRNKDSSSIKSGGRMRNQNKNNKNTNRMGKYSHMMNKYNNRISRGMRTTSIRHMNHNAISRHDVVRYPLPTNKAESQIGLDKRSSAYEGGSTKNMPVNTNTKTKSQYQHEQYRSGIDDIYDHNKEQAGGSKSVVGNNEIKYTVEYSKLQEKQVVKSIRQQDSLCNNHKTKIQNDNKNNDSNNTPQFQQQNHRDMDNLSTSSPLFIKQPNQHTFSEYAPSPHITHNHHHYNNPDSFQQEIIIKSMNQDIKQHQYIMDTNHAPNNNINNNNYINVTQTSLATPIADNLSNKCEQNLSNKGECEQQDDMSAKSFGSKRSQQILDASSMKSLIIDNHQHPHISNKSQQKRGRNIFVMDQVQVQSVHSGNNNNNNMNSNLSKRYHYININNKRNNNGHKNKIYEDDKSQKIDSNDHYYYNGIEEEEDSIYDHNDELANDNPGQTNLGQYRDYQNVKDVREECQVDVDRNLGEEKKQFVVAASMDRNNQVSSKSSRNFGNKGSRGNKTKGSGKKFTKKQLEDMRKMALTQLAPLCDRLGRLLVDLAPHVAAMGYTQFSDNGHFNQNLSTFTNQGSLQSRLRNLSVRNGRNNLNHTNNSGLTSPVRANSSSTMMMGQQEEQLHEQKQNQNQTNLKTDPMQGVNQQKMSRSSGKMLSNNNKSMSYQGRGNNSTNNRYWNFQIPVMLTPWQILRINRLLHEQAGQTLDVHGLSGRNNNNNNTQDEQQQ